MSAPLRPLLAEATARLAAAGVPSARVDAELLAAHVLGVPRGRLPLVDRLEAEKAAAFEDAVARRVAREPLQHIVGSVPFHGLDLAVGPGVFVPRPETELLAALAVDAARQAAVPAPGTSAGAARSTPVTVVDLCSGTGAVALAVAAGAPQAEVHAVERETDAFAWLQRNIARVDAGQRVTPHLADIALALPELNGQVDVIAANPPYLHRAQAPALEPEVRDHDPDAALYGGEDGTAGLRSVVAAATRLLRPAGVLIVEHGDDQAPWLEVLLSGWAAVRTHLDLARRPRATTARRP